MYEFLFHQKTSAFHAPWTWLTACHVTRWAHLWRIGIQETISSRYSGCGKFTLLNCPLHTLMYHGGYQHRYSFGLNNSSGFHRPVFVLGLVSECIHCCHSSGPRRLNRCIKSLKNHLRVMLFQTPDYCVLPLNRPVYFSCKMNLSPRSSVLDALTQTNTLSQQLRFKEKQTTSPPTPCSSQSCCEALSLQQRMRSLHAYVI